MGTWGSGIFQNDVALDYLAEIQEALVKRMEQIIANPSLAEPDEPTSAEVMVAVEIAAMLCEQFNAVPPEPDFIELCRDTYLQVWDGYIDKLAPNPDYKTERRETIGASFEKLLRRSQQWHSS